MKHFVIYDNGKWSIAAVRHGNSKIRVRVECLFKSWVDWPIRYADGRIVWDFPEKIPAYIKRITASIMDPKPRKDQWVRLSDMEGIL